MEDVFAQMLIQQAKSAKRQLFRMVLPILILAVVASFILGFILGALIF